MKKLILFFLIVVITSCDEQSDNNNSGVIMPLKAGNYWTFVDSAFDASGVFVYTDTSTLGITGKKTIEYNSSSYEVFFWTWGANADFSWLAWNGDDGLYLFGGTSPKQDYILTKTLSIKYPVEINDQWEKYNISFSSLDSTFHISDTLQMSCTSKNAALSSPLNDLTCYLYQYSRSLGKQIQNAPDVVGINRGVMLSKKGSSSTVKVYYVPNIGYVGLIDETDGVIVYKKTIISYLANK